MGTMTVAEEIKVSEGKAIRPFRIKVPEEELVDLRRRIAATRWPEKETVSDPSQGVPLATIQKLARYWGTDYNWRKCEARRNALPQFITEIDGLDNITLYWLTNTAVSSARIYWENKFGFFAPKGVAIPVAVSAFPDEVCAVPRSWAERAYPKLVYYRRHDKGGHFAAWEQPQLLSEDVRGLQTAAPIEEQVLTSCLLP